MKGEENTNGACVFFLLEHTTIRYKEIHITIIFQPSSTEV